MDFFVTTVKEQINSVILQLILLLIKSKLMFNFSIVEYNYFTVLLSLHKVTLKHSKRC